MRLIGFLLISTAAALGADLPVTQVVLYKHGIGFFERSGPVKPNETIQLDFDSSEMDDVLKSLVVKGQRGAVSDLHYDSMDPLSHKLEQFPFKIGEAQPLSAMLDQLKGARVELQMGNSPLAGVIVTGRVSEANDKQPQREELTLMLDNGELRTVDLGAASGVRFPDPKLQEQFKDYLAAVAASRSKDKRSVYFSLNGAAGAADTVTADYTIPMPVWKSSYRLIFGASGEPTLDGWAIVDNTTGEDWKNIRLSLVSGVPISFISHLYEPEYVDRPEADLPPESAARPVLHAGAFGGAGGGMAGAGGAGGAHAGGPIPVPAMAPRAAQMSAGQGQLMLETAPSSLSSTAEGQALGELFEYVIPGRVTIPKSGSAMLPFLQQQIQARKLLIYSDHSSEHPTNAAELTNSTGKTLDGGPITVYDAGAYGGEALMETLKAGDKRLISYAVDLGTRITSAFNSKQAVVREIHAARGLLITKMAAEQTTAYTIRNVDQKAKTLILEHPLRPAYDLLQPSATEKTASAYRFEIPLAAGATREFPVNEERIFEQSYSVSTLTPDGILAYAQNRTLSNAGRAALQRIAAQKNSIADNDRALSATRSQISDLTADEQRIRENITSLNAVSGQQQQVQNYARQLDAHEQQLAGLRDTQAQQEKTKTALEADLAKLVDGLEF